MKCFEQKGKTWNLDMQTIQIISGILENMVKNSSLKTRKRNRLEILDIIMKTDPLRDEW